jgi:hypothetical protein
MRVFIVGGENKTYLSFQLFQLRKLAVDLEQIVYVTTHDHQRDSPDDHDCIHLAMRNIPARSKSPWIQDIQAAICAKFTGGHDALILHGDTIPIATVDSDILKRKREAAYIPCVHAQWMLTNSKIGHQLTGRKDVTRWKMDQTSVGAFRMGLAYPSFIHLDNLSTDSIETCNQKLEALKSWLAVQIVRANPFAPKSLTLS